MIHTDDAALVADLERRLGGRVLRHLVKDIDYVRDTMVVDVRYRVWSRSTRARAGRAAACVSRRRPTAVAGPPPRGRSDGQAQP